MKLRFDHERVLAVVAHPDDAELLCAGTLARARADGAVIGICVLCRGDKGQPDRPIRHLAAVRRREMAQAAALLGAELMLAGFNDGELQDGIPQRRRLLDILRRFQPTLVLAHAATDYHADHRAASALTEIATWACASQGYRTRLPALERAPALWWMDTITLHQFSPGFYVDVTAFAPLKEQMLACHRSQLSRSQDRDFSPLRDLMRLQYQTRGAQAGVAAAEAFAIHAAFKRTGAW
ncbi:MAG: PIG-L family deacetylase [Opitutaceae bacterium]|nr:PIG-L family deacetylase [Opitutaceae bacterium]